MSRLAENGLVKAAEKGRPGELGTLDIPSSGPIKVLVVDDLPTNQKVLRHLLEKIGPVFVETCDNGKDAICFCREKSFDLVLMDLHMPIMTGFEAGAEILAERRGPLPLVVAQTADETPRAFRKTAEIGFDGHLGKPICRESIQRILESIRQIAYRELV